MYSLKMTAFMLTLIQGISTLGNSIGSSISGGSSSGKNACSSGLVYRRSLPCICSVSRSESSSRLFMSPVAPVR